MIDREKIFPNGANTENLPNLFRPREYAKGEIIEKGSFYEIKISSREDYNHEFEEEVSNERKLIQIVLQHEDLLSRFVKIDDAEDFFLEYAPALVTSIVERSKLEMNNDQIREVQHRWTLHRGSSMNLYIQNCRENTIYNEICRYADAYFQAKYLIETTERAKEIIKLFFPDLYKEFPYTVSILHIPDIENAEHSFSSETGKHNLRLMASESLDNIRDFNGLKTEGVFKKGYHFSRKIHDLLSIIHELAHGIYQETVSGGKKKRQCDDYYSTADAAINEGFAILLELLSCDYLIKYSNPIGLNLQETKDLLEWKKQRLASLLSHSRLSRNVSEDTRKARTKGMAYTEGIVKIMHKIYKKGGIKGVKRFLEAIDTEKTRSLMRESKEYTESIKEGAKGLKAFCLENYKP